MPYSLTTYHARSVLDEPLPQRFRSRQCRCLGEVHTQQKSREGPDPRSNPLVRLCSAAHEDMHTVAKLGAFRGRKSDGDPEVKTLWRGYRELPTCVWALSRALDRPSPPLTNKHVKRLCLFGYLQSTVGWSSASSRRIWPVLCKTWWIGPSE